MRVCVDNKVLKELHANFYLLTPILQYIQLIDFKLGRENEKGYSKFVAMYYNVTRKLSEKVTKRGKKDYKIGRVFLIDLFRVVHGLLVINKYNHPFMRHETKKFFLDTEKLFCEILWKASLD